MVDFWCGFKSAVTMFGHKFDFFFELIWMGSQMHLYVDCKNVGSIDTFAGSLQN